MRLSFAPSDTHYGNSTISKHSHIFVTYIVDNTPENNIDINIAQLKYIQCRRMLKKICHIKDESYTGDGYR